ncbi:MAG: GGDEF domain-containing protein [Planctomycetes bacterium]|nr:GGDEF domain-containing protein [Planctomycetota bacterium]
MNRASAAEILILAQQPATAQRWSAMLQGPETRIWLADDDVPDPTRLDLILTDRPLGEQATTATILERLPDGEAPGVIRIGVEGPADVRLPTDVSERELRLVSGLLAEVVRLRREKHARTETHRRLAEEALTDPLTGIPNRRAWDRAVRRWLDTAAGPTRRICLAIIDLDHFKRVNDTHGYATGDNVLRAAAEVISESLRQADFVARLGGDEFGLLLRVDDEGTARRVLDRVRGRLAGELPPRGVPSVTASAGFQFIPPRNPAPPLPSPESLFIAADAALRQAKHDGRDRTVGGSTE